MNLSITVVAVRKYKIPLYTLVCSVAYRVVWLEICGESCFHIVGVWQKIIMLTVDMRCADTNFHLFLFTSLFKESNSHPLVVS